MGEGRTPLIDSARIAPSTLFFKLETTNPTGSYKDRFIAREVAHAIARGQRVCVATSSGNTGSSLAAYCARFGLKCIVAVNANAPAGKLMQMQAHGATVIRIPGFVTSAEITRSVFSQLQDLADAGETSLVVSAFRYCPVGMEGVRTIATEILRDLPEVEHIFVPVGGGGLFVAVAEEVAALRPETKVHAVQPEGCPTLLTPFRDGSDTVLPVDSTTKISGLSVPFDIDASRALQILRRTGGQAIGVSDEEVFAAQKEMFLCEGIFCEPAGATALAGWRKAQLKAGATSVCVVTGHGLKDPAPAQMRAGETPGFLVPDSALSALLKELTQ
jgi:threonine synthase